MKTNPALNLVSVCAIASIPCHNVIFFDVPFLPPYILIVD